MPIPLIGLGLQALVTSLVPAAAKHLFGSGGEAVAKEIVGVATEVFGSNDEREIEKAIAKDPALAMQFKLRVMEIADKESERKFQLIVEELNDVKNARAMQQATNGNTVPSLALATVLLFFVSNGLMLYGAYMLLTTGINVKNTDLAVAVAGFVGQVAGFVNAKTDMVYGFFFGSSVSARSNAANTSNALADIAKKATSSK